MTRLVVCPTNVIANIAQFAIARHLGCQIPLSENDEASGLFVVSDGELRSIRQNLEGRNRFCPRNGEEPRWPLYPQLIANRCFLQRKFAQRLSASCEGQKYACPGKAHSARREAIGSSREARRAGKTDAGAYAGVLGVCMALGGGSRGQVCLRSSEFTCSIMCRA